MGRKKGDGYRFRTFSIFLRRFFCDVTSPWMTSSMSPQTLYVLFTNSQSLFSLKPSRNLVHSSPIKQTKTEWMIFT